MRKRQKIRLPKKHEDIYIITDNEGNVIVEYYSKKTKKTLFAILVDTLPLAYS